MSGAGLSRAFRAGRPALITYVMAGYPTRADSLEALRALAEAGADAIELGVPFADPLADGPVIREAADIARSSNPGGFGLAETIDLAEEFLGDPGVEQAPPVALMTYLNPIMQMGFAQAAQRMTAAGIGGVIVPDMPPDVAGPWLATASGLDTVFLVAPTSTPERLARVGRSAGGFVYVVSTTGVTGERSELPAGLAELVARVREHTTLPVAIGFGVGTPGQAAAIARIADGVIVGSAIVKRQCDLPQMAAFVSDLARAVRTDS